MQLGEDKIANLFEKVNVVEIFQLVAHRNPHAVAVAHNDIQLTYRQLDEESNQVAQFLLQKGVQKEQFIGVCMERSAAMIITIIGIIKAGAAYIPIDPQYPADRRNFMLADADIKILLTQQSLSHLFTSATVALYYIGDAQINQQPKNEVGISISPNNLIYCIYTSGSTGTPKGVLIEHRNVIKLTQGHCKIRNTCKEIFLFSSSFAFDGSVVAIFPTLLNGGTIAILPDGLEKDVQQIVQYIHKYQVSHILTFPSAYGMLLDRADTALLASLRAVSVAGEVCPVSLVKKHQQLLPNAQLYNEYGPTECTVCATVYAVPKNFGGAKTPIGKPLENYKVYILDGQLQPVPAEWVGEIYIGGSGVARGYLNRPQLTAERFIQNPFSKNPEDRLYKTGDVGQQLADGNFDFIGRSDYQVKLRGFRIELGEIENVITLHAAIRDVVVVVKGTDTATQKLVAYLTTQQSTTPSVSELQHFLASYLPDYMLPAVYVFMDEMPLSPNGKIDRKALPEPSTDRPLLEQLYAPPSNAIELHIVDKWEQLLGIHPIGIHDKFFELGGNSIQAAQFIADLSAVLQDNVFIVTIFEHPTPAEYAQFLQKEYVKSIKNIAPEKANIIAKQSSQKPAKTLRQFKKHIPLSQPFFAKLAHKNSPAVFILAPPRSGTTLLRVMLAGHPNLFAANELQLLHFDTLQERSTAYQGKFSLWKEGLVRTVMELQHTDADAAKALIATWEARGMTAQQCYRQLQEWVGTPLLVDKSPSYSMDIETLRRAEAWFDGAYYIHLIRHPYSMIKSFEKMRMSQAMYLYDNPYDGRDTGELIWAQSHQNILQFLEEIPAQRQFKMLYEDLVQQPQAVMQSLCNTFAWEYHADLVQPYQNIDKKMTDGLYTNSKPMGDVNLLKHKNIDASLSDNWKGVLTDNFLSEETWQVANAIGIEIPSKLQKNKTVITDTSSNDIAIIGMSGRFPGANNIEEFWQNLVEAADVSKRLTPSDLADAGIDATLLQQPGYVAKAFYLNDADCFDAEFFGYLPNEAALMDPQHRVFLESAVAALEDAGYVSDTFDGKIGIIGSVARNTYLVNNAIPNKDIFDNTDDFLLGVTLEKDFPATRVAYKLNLKGPALNVQTACSSSGVGIHLACQQLQLHEADIMLVGGGRIQPPLATGYQYKDGHALSPDGYCHTFDAEAKGMVRGNGMAFLVLKKLDKALADGDNIRAIIKGTGISNDGNDKIGFTAPSINGQAAAIAQAYQKSGVHPDTIQYIEAHGTGTQLGDPIEIAGLTKAFKQFTDKKQFCQIGSVKTNIGHLDSGACIAGIIKTALALKHQLLPASMHFQKSNPQIAFEHTPFIVQDVLQKWQQQNGIPRRAGVSSFGLGGTNVHIVLEEAPIRPDVSDSKTHYLLPLSAKTLDALRCATENLANYLTHISNNSANVLRLRNVAFTLQNGRQSFDKKLFIVAHSVDNAIAQLSKIASQNDLPLHPTTLQQPRIVFAFPGGGAQHTNMGKDLYEQESVFRAAVTDCLARLQKNHQLTLQDILYPQHNESLPIEDPLHAIVTLFVVEYATAKLWQSWGVTPHQLIGHSVGEYVAALLAGVFSLDDALAIVVKRGELFLTLPQGKMLSVPLSEADLQTYLTADSSIAVINKPNLCVVSGTEAAIVALQKQLADNNIDSALLHIQVAAHSHLVAPILPAFEAFLQNITFNAPQLPIISNLSGDWATDDIATPAYWLNHLRKTVRFSDGLSKIFEQPDNFLILEVGPSQTLSAFAKQHPNKPVVTQVFASLRHPKEVINDMAFILKTLGQLWQSGIAIHWNELYTSEKGYRVPLPTYPFARVRHWLSPKPHNTTPTLDPIKTNHHAPVITNTYTTNTMATNKTVQALEKVKDVFHQLSGMSKEAMHPDATFLELGFDSLFLTQATAKINSQFGTSVSFRQLFEEYPTMGDLATIVAPHLPTDVTTSEIDKAAIVQAMQPNVVLPLVRQPMNVTLPEPVLVAVGEPSGALAGVIQQQLLLMQQQLAVLSGNNTATPTVPISPPQVSPTPALSAQQPTLSQNTVTLTPQAHQAHGPWKPLEKKTKGTLTTEQQQHLAAFIQKYVAKTKGSQELTQSQRRHLADPRSISGFNKLYKDIIYQIAVERSKGSKVWDVDGNEYIDFRSSFGISLFGHTPDFVQQAIYEQTAKGIELGVLPPMAKKVGDLLCELTGMERVTLVNTGSESLSAAVRAARTVTNRSKIIVFDGDYHGIADELLAKGVTVNGELKSLPTAPGIPNNLVEQMVVLNYDDPDVLQKIEQLAPELAAVIIEPIQPGLPSRQPKAIYQGIRKLADQHNFAFIFDEMITGFRIAQRGAQAWYGIDADIVAYGKIMSGGLPIAAVAGKAKYLDVFDGGYWEFGDDSVPPSAVTFFGGTFVRHPLCLATAYAALSEIKRRGKALYDELNEKSEQFAERLIRLVETTRAPLQVSAASSIISVRVLDTHPLANLVFHCLRLRGVHWTDKAGLITTEHSQEDLDKTYNAFAEAINEMFEYGFFSPLAMSTENVIVYSEKKKLRQPNTIPLTEAQKEVWIEHQLSSEAAAAFNLGMDFRFRGTLDIANLQAALSELIDRHEALRTQYNKTSLTQTILPQADCLLTITDVTDEATLETYRQKAATQPLDLFVAPLLRAELLRLSAKDHTLLLTVHHGIADGAACGVLINELIALYNGKLLPEPTQLSAFVREELSFAESAAFTQQQSYWLAQFKNNLPAPLDFPTDFSHPSVKTFDAAWQTHVISEELSQKIRKYAAKQGSTLFVMMYAAFHSFVARLSHQDDVVVGITASSTTNYPQLVAHGVSVLPVRAQINMGATFGEQLKHIRSIVLNAFDHQRYTLGTLVKALALPHDRSRQPLISFLFNIDAEGAPLVAEDLQIHCQAIQRKYETFDTFINVKPKKDNIALEWIYNTALFLPDTIAHRLQEFEVFLDSICTQPDLAIYQHRVLPTWEANQLKSWNQTQKAVPQSDECIHHRILAQATKTPHHIAVVANGKAWTYQQLVQEAQCLAACLQSHGVQVGDMVGVFLERSNELLAALIAVLQVGGVYVPLDPSNPSDRLQTIAEDADCKYVLTQTTLAEKLGNISANLLTIDTQNTLTGEFVPPSHLNPKQYAYINYTSGSTGKPKGVLIPHYAVINHHTAFQEILQLTAQDTWLSVASVAFDPSVLDFFLPLFVGAKVVIANDTEKLDGRLLQTLLATNTVTVMQATPATWQMLLTTRWHGNPSLTILTGGEPLTRELAAQLLSRSKAVYNIYGPTETTIWTTIKKVSATEPAYANSMPIGRPIANTQVHLLDEWQQPVPIGVVGEVYIGGLQVAPSGYFKRPEMTNHSFISANGKGVLYRTGDMARLLPSGDIEYLYRSDNQVKIRGFRVEIGEIEAAISTHPIVKQVAVVPHKKEGDTQLVAYIVSTDTTFDVKEIRNFLKTLLPPYMIPAFYSPMEVLPLNASLKIDRKKLAALPPVQKTPVLKETITTPIPTHVSDNAILLGLYALWCDVLGYEEINVDDDFFEIGGTSLMAVQMMVKLEEQVGKNIPVAVLLQCPTIRTLADYIAEKATVQINTQFTSLITIRPNGDKTPLYLVHGAGLHVLMYQTLISNMDDTQPIFALQAKGIDGESEPLDSIEEMAAHYIAEIQQLNPDGPYCLAGYSFGGLIAFEMAKQLQAQGKEVKFLGVFDTAVRREIMLLPDENILDKMSRSAKSVSFNTGLLLKDPVKAIKYKAHTIRRRWQMQYATDDAKGATFGSILDKKNRAAFEHYKITPYNGRIYLFKAQEQLFFLDDFDNLGWKPYAQQGVEIIDVIGNHLTLFNDKNGEYLAHKLQSCLDQL